jgi:hypothetical protein
MRSSKPLSLPLSLPSSFMRGAIAAIALTLIATPASAQTAISPGFSPNPINLRGTGGGSVPATNIAGTVTTGTGDCTGFVESNPDQTIVLRSFFPSLSLNIRSSEDTSVVVKGPGGVWCNDDDNDKNPGITGQWLEGTYRVWVGSYAQGRRPNYTLQLRQNP